MARRVIKSINNFIELDSTTSDATKYINVRDLQVFRSNYNSILARGIRRNVCNMTFKYSSGNTYECKKTSQLGSLAINDNVPIARARIYLSSAVRTLKIWARAALESASYAKECAICTHVMVPTSPRDLDRKRLMTWDTHGVIAEKATTIDLPMYSRTRHSNALREFEIAFYMLPELSTTDILVSGPVSISSSSYTSITVSSAPVIANITAGDIIETTSGERQVVKQVAGSAITIHGRWQDPPTGFLVYAAHVPRLTMHNLSVSESNFTSFHQTIQRL